MEPPVSDGGEPVGDLVEEDDEQPEGVEREGVPEEERGAGQGQREQQAARRRLHERLGHGAAYCSTSSPFSAIHFESCRMRPRNAWGGSKGTGPADFAAARTSAASVGRPLSP